MSQDQSDRPHRVPRSTYRFQISPDFTLFDAAERLDYLHDLGVDWVYLSPILQAEAGSSHGYDVVAHGSIDPARGGAEGLAALSAKARGLGMGVLVDIVPNHIGVATPQANAWWADVLAHGRDSAYADWFDVDWDAGDGQIRDGADDLNYRRFFTITSLAGLRVEVPAAFAASHAEIGRWFAEGLVDGLRVDHPDGLFDPAGYLDDLAELIGGAYVVVEKILETGEELSTDWATDGTTGYDALAFVDRVLTDPAGERPLTDLAVRLGAPEDWADLIHDTKRRVADTDLHPEVRRIVRDLEARAEPAEVVDAVAEVLACFPVYRSYLPLGVEHLDHAVADATRRRPDLTEHLAVLHRRLADPAEPGALRFQQTSGMVMAKGVEDCAFYRYPRLTSLNEVGGDPSVFSVAVADFHAAMAHRQESWPEAMTCLTTHDTKRSEDARARITVLAEMPEQWDAALTRLLDLAPVPDRAFGSLLWQAVLGAWEPGDPALRDRLHAYAEKAMREAGQHTGWIDPNDSYESAVHAAVDAAFDDPRVVEVIADLVATTALPGWTNALSAKLLALTMPGVPDVYQGTALFDHSLVDPDNRRPIDYRHREDLLAGEVEDLAAPKLEVVRTALRLRRDRPDLFTGYASVLAQGDAAEHVLAFDRGGALTVVTRLPVGLATRGGWGETRLDLPTGRWVDAFTGRRTDGALGAMLADLPVALLVREDE